MVSVFTPNIQLEEPARGDDVGTWDTPVNANMTLIDLVVGGTATIPLAGAGVVLAAAQFQAKTIVFNSTLTANVSITFPTSFTKSYEVYHQCTGSSAFTIQLLSTSGGPGVCVPPGECVDVINVAGAFVFKNLGRIGHYWDHGGSSVPNWVSGCSVPPYLNCDGTAFSSATYPNLRNFLGSATLPDSRGRARFALNQTTNRITVAGTNLNGDTLAAGGGDQQPAAHSHTGTTGGQSNDHTHQYNAPIANTTTGGGAFQASGNVVNSNITTGFSADHTHTFTTNNSGTGNSGNLPPAYIGGITLIRAG